MSLASVKSRLFLPFWYRLTWVVPEKGPLNVCVCVYMCVYMCVCVFSSMKLLVCDDVCCQLNFDVPLEQQGPFDMIFHKLTDQVTCSSDRSQLTFNYAEVVQVLCVRDMTQYYYMLWYAVL